MSPPILSSTTDALQNITTPIIFHYHSIIQTFTVNCEWDCKIINQLIYKEVKMGNAKQRSLTAFQYNIALSSIVKTVHFQSKVERDQFIQLTNRRMRIRSPYVPRIIYYHNVESPLSIKLYFENFGKPIQQFSQHSIEPFCKCIDVLTTIDQLRQLYGIFGFSLRQVFFKVQETHKSIFVWIGGDVQKYQGVKIGSEQKMCGSVLTTLKNLCSMEHVEWREDNGGKFQHLSDLIDWVRQRHTQHHHNAIRTPRTNYQMRKSNDLTIFPNQYQQKFIKKYRQKCKQQQSERFQTFKRAMLRCKTKTQQLQTFSFIFKGKGHKQ